jgi:hypothetical protein
MDEKQQIHDIINQLHDIINIKYIKKQNKEPPGYCETNSVCKTPKYHNIDFKHYQKINKTVSQYTSFDFKTNYGVGNIKNLFNHISKILISQQETINKLEQSIREINKKLPQEINKSQQFNLSEETLENKKIHNNPFDDI